MIIQWPRLPDYFFFDRFFAAGFDFFAVAGDFALRRGFDFLSDEGDRFINPGMTIDAVWSLEAIAESNSVATARQLSGPGSNLGIVI